MSPPSSRSKNKPSMTKRESRWKAEQSACRNFGLYRKEKMEVEDISAVLVGSPVGQNQPSACIGSQTHPVRVRCKEVCD
jgi:hypothetical protein